MFTIKYLPILRRHDEIWRLLDWNCTDWWWNSREIKISNLPKFYYQPIGQQVWHAWQALFFCWWHEKSAWCHFGVIWHDWRIHNFTHSLTVNILLSSSLFSLLHLNFELSFSFCSFRSSMFFSVKIWVSRWIAIIKIILSQILTQLQNAHLWKYSKLNHDLAAKLP